MKTKSKTKAAPTRARTAAYPGARREIPIGFYPDTLADAEAVKKHLKKTTPGKITTADAVRHALKLAAKKGTR